MKVTLHSTSKVLEIVPEGYVAGGRSNSSPVKARLWEGTTDSGVPVHCFILRIAHDESLPPEQQAQFARELQSTDAPTVTPKAYDMRLFL